MDFLFGLARNARLEETVKSEIIAASLDAIRSGRPARRFKDFRYATLDSWGRERRVIGKAEVTGDKANPRFIVTPTRSRLRRSTRGASTRRSTARAARWRTASRALSR